MEDILEYAQTEVVGRETKSRKLNWKLRVALILLKGIAMITFIIVASFIIHAESLKFAEFVTKKADAFYVSTLEKLPKSIIPKESTLASRLPLSLAEAISRVAREQRVPAVALAAMVEQESSNNQRPTSQLEMRTYRRLLKTMPNTPEEEIKELATGHGPGHVMGITAREICDLEPAELYDTYKGLTCAAKYLRIQLDKSKGDSVDTRLWQAFKGYNGTGPAAEVHANKVYAIMRKKMTGSLSKELS